MAGSNMQYRQITLGYEASTYEGLLSVGRLADFQPASISGDAIDFLSTVISR